MIPTATTHTVLVHGTPSHNYDSNTVRPQLGAVWGSYSAAFKLSKILNPARYF